jgi:hypothetical protein
MLEGLQLTKKEQRLADLIAKTDADKLNIGYACRELHTTPRTLLGVTMPGLRKKLEAYATPQQITAAKRAAYGHDT